MMCASLCAPWTAAAQSQIFHGEQRLVACWQHDHQEFLGVLRMQDSAWQVEFQLPLPTRGHGLWADGQGAVWLASRRPGDWLLKWMPMSGHTHWYWHEDDQRFNGHVLLMTQDTQVVTTETRLEDGQGRIRVRDAKNLTTLADWPSGGMDPHQIKVLPESLGPLPAGTLLVANGGIYLRAETGRAKRHDVPMDSNLTALDLSTGQILGQWRVADQRLSLRHLSWNPQSQRLGIAIQAEHLDTQERSIAPVLAVFDGYRLNLSDAQPPLAGYGGDIAWLPQGGFVVSCPRANALAFFNAQGACQTIQHQPGAYALTQDPLRWWNAGSHDVATGHGSKTRRHLPMPERLAGWAWDNHWLAL